MATVEELQEQMLKMQEQLENITAENNNYKTLVEEQKTNIEDSNKKTKELQELNQKLFLKVTDSKYVSEDKVKEDNEEEMKLRIGEKVYNVMSDQDKELYKMIIEGDEENYGY